MAVKIFYVKTSHWYDIHTCYCAYNADEVSSSEKKKNRSLQSWHEGWHRFVYIAKVNIHEEDTGKATSYGACHLLLASSCLPFTTCPLLQIFCCLPHFSYSIGRIFYTKQHTTKKRRSMRSKSNLTETLTTATKLNFSEFFFSHLEGFKIVVLIERKK